MKKKNLNRIVAALAIACCSASLLGTPVYAAEAVDTGITTSNDGTGVSTRAAIKQWVYKEENGKIYKRLMNCSTGQWEGDWIYVRDGYL
jgi:hypothetical protein